MWGELIRKFTEHLVERYGREEVSTWYFEVWNEPDISYWHGTPAEYFKLYDYAVAGVRAALPNAMVGGPASTGPNVGKSRGLSQSLLEALPQRQERGKWKADSAGLYFVPSQGQAGVCGRPCADGNHQRVERESTPGSR